MSLIRNGVAENGRSGDGPASQRRFPASGRRVLLTLGAVRGGVAGFGRCVARPSSPRRFPASCCWDWALCGSASLTAAIPSKLLLELGAVRGGVAGIGRCAARPSPLRRFPASGPRTAAIPSKSLLALGAVRLALPHSGDSQQASPTQRRFSASVVLQRPSLANPAA